METRDLVLAALRRTRRHQKTGDMTPALRRRRALLAAWLHDPTPKHEHQARAIATETIRKGNQ